MKELLAGVAIGFLIAITICAIAINQSRINYYKQGQIDYATGIVKYNLIIKPDSTRVWEKVESQNNR